MATAHLMTSNLVSALLAYGATGQVCTTSLRLRPVDWIECNPHRLMYIASRADGATFEMPSAERAVLWLDPKPTRALSPDNS